MKKLVSVLLALALCVAFAAVCGAEEVHEHSWGGWQTQSAATCTREGLQVRICSTCGEVESDTIPKNDNHSWGGWETQRAATCAVEGMKVRICSACGETERDTIPTKNNHSWGGWETQKAPTCTSDGLQVRLCGACGETEKNTLSAPGHTSVTVSGKDATCTESGLTDGTKCSACGTVLTAQQTIPAKGHKSVTVPGKAATCTESGLTDGAKCSVCDTVLTAQQTIPAKGHKSVTVPGKAATCTESGLTDGAKCSVCGTVLTAQQTIPAKGHKSVTVPGKAATCTESGLTDGAKCSVCSTVLTVQQTIPAKGHTKETIPGKAATCTETGLVAGVKCSVCNVVLVEQKEIPAKGHTEMVVPGKAATCAEDGLTDGAKCAVCGVVTVAQQAIQATGHSFEVRVYAATTTYRGYTKHTCTTCGETFKDNWVPKLASAVVTETPKPSAEPQASLYGSIVTDAGRDVTAYDCTLDSAGNLLEIVAAAEADGSYALRNLHITAELLDQLKSDGIEYIRFVVGDAALLLPLSVFDSEDVALVVADMKQELTGYVVTVDPTALTASNENGCQVSVVATTIDGDEMDITAFAAGLQLTAGGQTVDVTESAVYPIG